MRFSVLSSGSKANSTFLECGNHRILIDCGLSCRETERRLLQLGIAADSIKSILITHEHSDHIKGVAQFSKKHRVPVYANADTAKFMDDVYGLEHFESGARFSIGNIKIFPFSITHDARDPVGFTVEYEGLRYGQATDLGRVTKLVRASLLNCNALLIESNHDEEMLQTCSYSWDLKKRIASSHGHLSNTDAANLISDLVSPELLHLVLGHISENSNTTDLALSSSRGILGDRVPETLIAANVYDPTPLFEVGEYASSASVG